LQADAAIVLGEDAEALELRGPLNAAICRRVKQI
jgi:hypothetical protein